MTIVFEGRGDILASKMHTLVNPVNTIGAMGKGLAKEFKLKYPDYYAAYQKACMCRVFQLEKCFVYRADDGHQLYSLPTKSHWRGKSRLEWIDAGLETLVTRLDQYGVKSLAIPAIGCGEGGLNWPDVHDLLHKWLDHVEIDVEIYIPWTKKEE